MLSKRYGFLLSFAICLSSVQAQSVKRFSLTTSPIHLTFPVFELTGEYALAPKFGVAAIGGFGGMDVKNSVGNTVGLPVLELGLQANYYLVGDFGHGMQVGGELLWIKVDPPKDEGVTVDVNGLAVGPMVGYKWAASFGLTFMAQAGYQFLFAKAEAEDANGQQVEGSSSTGVPLINLNLGWSF